MPKLIPIVTREGEIRGYLFVQQGMIQYCPDSRHELSGKTVAMMDFDLDRWEAREATPMAKDEKEKRQTSHHGDCGDVGETGAHGEIGSNAADHPDRSGKKSVAISTGEKKEKKENKED